MESADELLEHLDPEQREVATRFGVPLCVRAGAGTGKTRAITYRIAYAARAGILDPRNVMALTFTSRAAGELRSRLRDLGVRKMRLLGSPRRIPSMAGFGLEVTGYITRPGEADVLPPSSASAA